MEVAGAARVLLADDPVGGGGGFAPGDATPVVAGGVLAEVAEFGFLRGAAGAGAGLQLVEDGAVAGLLADRWVERLQDADVDSGAADAEAEGEACGELHDDRFGDAAVGPDDIDRQRDAAGGGHDGQMELAIDRRGDFEREAGQERLAVLYDERAVDGFAGHGVGRQIEAQVEAGQHQTVDEA